jgi:hypothetical protein
MGFVTSGETYRFGVCGKRSLAGSAVLAGVRSRLWTLDLGLWTFFAYVKDLSMLRFGRVEDGTMEVKAAPGGRNADAGVAQHG